MLPLGACLTFSDANLISSIPGWLWSICSLLLAGKRISAAGDVSYRPINCKLVSGAHRHWRLSNEKPSAIFRLRGAFTPASIITNTTHQAFANAASDPNNASDITAVLGFSIEPLPQILSQISSLSSNASTAAGADLSKNPIALADKVVKHLFNYVSSFLGGVVTPDTVVPMSIIARWYENFLGKLKAGGVGFLERSE